MKGLVVQREPVREPGRRSCCRDVGQAQGGLWGTALTCRPGARRVLGTPQPRERGERDAGPAWGDAGSLGRRESLRLAPFFRYCFLTCPRKVIKTSVFLSD